MRKPSFDIAARTEGARWGSASSHDIDDTRQGENGVGRRCVDDGVQDDRCPTEVSYSLVGYC
jgi:hypothetical protein